MSGKFIIETGKYPKEYYQRDGETREQAVEREEKGEREHFEKYDAIARRFGIPSLIRMMPYDISPERVLSCLKSGDYHLNTIRLAAWDAVAGGYSPYPGHPLRKSFSDGGKYVASLSERVCLLKHVARHYYAEGKTE